MIETIVKFKMETRDWPYVVEFNRNNDQTEKAECLTLRTGEAPKASLIKAASRVARLALKYHGLEVLSGESFDVGVSLASVTWSEGDLPGSKVEVFLTTPLQLDDEDEHPVVTKLPLTKVDRFDETKLVGEGFLKTKVHVENSVKDEYNAAVRELRELVKDFAQGATEQGNLFSETIAQTVDKLRQDGVEIGVGGRTVLAGAGR